MRDAQYNRLLRCAPVAYTRPEQWAESDLDFRWNPLDAALSHNQSLMFSLD